MSQLKYEAVSAISADPSERRNGSSAPVASGETTSKEQKRYQLPDVATLKLAQRPKDVPHSDWSPTQKMAFVYDKCRVASHMSEATKALMQTELLDSMVEICGQLTYEKDTRQTQNIETWLTFVVLCQNLADVFNQETRDQLAMLSYEALLRCVGGGEWSKVGSLQSVAAKHAAAAAAHPDLAFLQKLRAASFALGEGLSDRQRLERVLPARELGGYVMKPGDLKRYYLLCALHHVGRVQVLAESSKNDRTVVPPTQEEINEMVGLQAVVARMLENRLDWSELNELLIQIETDGVKEGAVVEAASRVDKTTFDGNGKALDLTKLEELLDRLNMLMKKVNVRPLVDKVEDALASNIFSRLYSLQNNTDPTGVEKRVGLEQRLGGVLHDMSYFADPALAVRTHIEAARYYGVPISMVTRTTVPMLNGMLRYEKKVIKMERRLDAMRQSLELAIEMMAKVPTEARLILDKSVVSTCLSYLALLDEGGSDSSKELGDLYALLKLNRFSPESMETLTAKLASRQDGGADRSGLTADIELSRRMAEIEKLQQLLKDPHVPDDQHIRNCIALAKLYYKDEELHDPDLIIECLHNSRFYVLTYARQLRRFGEMDKGKQDVLEGLEKNAFLLRAMLAKAILNSLLNHYGQQNSIDDVARGEIENKMREAMELHPEVSQLSADVAELLLSKPAE